MSVWPSALPTGSASVRAMTSGPLLRLPLAQRFAFDAAQGLLFANFEGLTVPGAAEVEAIRAALARQLHTPVRWVETVQALKTAGIERVIECGPGKVLAGLCKRIDDTLPAVALVDEAS
ncbi:MAG: hypothetical protein ACLGIW_22165, partial [Gammaproteobacteria bacterium]